jgi:hypothetical protein
MQRSNQAQLPHSKKHTKQRSQRTAVGTYGIAGAIIPKKIPLQHTKLQQHQPEFATTALDV